MTGHFPYDFLFYQTKSVNLLITKNFSLVVFENVYVAHSYSRCFRNMQSAALCKLCRLP